MAKRKQEPPLLIDREAAAFQLGIPVSSLDKLVRDGQLRHVRIGRKNLFLRSVLLDFALERLEVRAQRYQPKKCDAVASGEMVN